MQIQPFFARFLEHQKRPAASPLPANLPTQLGPALKDAGSVQTMRYPSDSDQADPGSVQTMKYPSDSDFADLGVIPHSATKPLASAKADPLGLAEKVYPHAKQLNPLGLWLRANSEVKQSKGLQEAGGASSGTIHTMAFPSDSDATDGRLRF